MYTLLTISIFVLLLSSQGSERNATGSHLPKEIHDTANSVIKSIDSLGKVYIIYIERRDSILKLVSEKKTVHPCNRVQVGEAYPLKVKSLMTNFSNKRHISGVDYMGTKIYLDDKYGAIWDIFVSGNLYGLCFTPVNRFE